MFSVLLPSLPHAKACVLHNCDTNVHIKFIFAMAIYDQEWKNHFVQKNTQKFKLHMKWREMRSKMAKQNKIK